MELADYKYELVFQENNFTQLMDILVDIIKFNDGSNIQIEFKKFSFTILDRLAENCKNLRSTCQK